MTRKYLFIMCPPGSGSTALWKLVQTSPNVSALPKEGQYLDGVTDKLRRMLWDVSPSFPWREMKRNWEEIWDLNQPVLLEKSPPNLRHGKRIEEVFAPAYFLVMVRNPYAFCEGTKRRKRGAHSRSYRRIAERWVADSLHQIRNIEELEHVTYFTYEQFTENAEMVTERILAFMPDLEELDLEASFLIHSIHGAKRRPLTNLNPIQIARLKTKDVIEINSVLKQHADVMSYFGYEYLDVAYDPVADMRKTLAEMYRKYVVHNWKRGQRRLKRLLVQR